VSELKPNDDLMEDENDEVICDAPKHFTSQQKMLWSVLIEDVAQAARIVNTMEADGIEVIRSACDTKSAIQIAAAIDTAAIIEEPMRTCLLVELLNHDSLDVRLDAIAQLETSVGPNGVDLLRQFLASGEDAGLRGRVALLLGRSDNAALIEDIKSAYAQTTSTEVQKDYDLALARLGSQDALNRVGARLKTKLPLEKLIAIRNFIYLASPRVLKVLTSELDDNTPILNLRPMHSNYENWLRTCDIVVEVISIVAPSALSFDPVADPRAALSDEQIQEAREFLINLDMRY
jgi:hypothetical protein